jgi:hypothetical protein
LTPRPPSYRVTGASPAQRDAPKLGWPFSVGGRPEHHASHGRPRLGKTPRALSGGIHTVRVMPTLEEITYEAGRSALADQESTVTGIRQRTGTLLAAHALVASFLGATAVHAQGLRALGWLAVAALILGLASAAIVLAPWRLKFAVDAQVLYDQLYEQAAAEASAETLGWLASAGYSYQALREENAPKVRRMAWLSGAFAVLMVAQTLAWLTALAVD